MYQAHTSFSVPKKILVPMDFSPSSFAALEMATDLASHFHAELSLLNVVPMFPIPSGPDYYPEAGVIQDTSDAERQLADCTSALAEEGVPATSCVEVGNDVVGNIMMVIDREHIDMIVLSTHGTSGWRPIVFGSIAEKIVKLATCPLMLMRSLPPASTSGVALQAA